jgi:hypothetical protein
MDDIKEMLEAVEDLESVKQASKIIKSMEHIRTSKADIAAIFREKINELGIEYDKEAGDFVVKSTPTCLPGRQVDSPGEQPAAPGDTTTGEE